MELLMVIEFKNFMVRILDMGKPYVKVEFINRDLKCVSEKYFRKGDTLMNKMRAQINRLEVAKIS